MPTAIKIQAGGVTLDAELNDTATAKAIAAALPIKARAQTWGDEIYFSIPVDCGEENAREVVELGDIGYWPPGKALCFFFGPTPVSSGDEIRPASAVNIVGKIKGDAKALKAVRSGAPVEVCGE
ncbi:MAG: cyclophilin-like fold protein [Candidatus Sumerlaeia bacterium]|nr:cyclophilin-like fold protein [Candidatus Sumerlaeia bacterium]